MPIIKRKILKRYLNIALIFLSVMALLVMSELIYVVNNQPDYWVSLKMRYYTSGAKLLAENGFERESLRLMGKVAENLVDREKRLNENERTQDKSFKGVSWSGKGFDEVYAGITNEIDVDRIAMFDSYYLSSVYYAWGLRAFEFEEYQLAINLLEISSQLSPNWSYYSLELANLMKAMGMNEEARSIIFDCMENFYTRKHCSTYEELLSNTVMEVGFMSEDIENELN